MGRRVKLDDELQKNAVDLISIGVPESAVCDAVGISEQTFYRWMRYGEQGKSPAYRSFFEAIKKGRARAISMRVSRIYKAGKEQWTANAWWLERVRPDLFGRMDRLDAQVRGSMNIKVVFGKSGSKKGRPRRGAGKPSGKS
jgi:transposase-like protein